MFFDITKSGRLKTPNNLKKLSEVDVSGLTVNWCGQPVAKIGEFVAMTGVGIGAGTVGKLVAIEDLGKVAQGTQGNLPDYWLGATVETLDGKRHGAWLYTLTVLDLDAVLEVKNFYVAAGRSHRVSVAWL